MRVEIPDSDGVITRTSYKWSWRQYWILSLRNRGTCLKL